MAIYHQPVTRSYLARRGSLLRGREILYWKSINRRDARNIVLAARIFDTKGRRRGKRNGPLGHIALEVLDYMANLVDYRTGRLEPSLLHLSIKLKRSRSAIVVALKALRKHGFIGWQRRYVPVDDPTGRIKVQQTSNAYWLLKPDIVNKLKGNYGKEPPQSDDYIYGKNKRQSELSYYRSQLPLQDKPYFDMGLDNTLAQALSRLGQALQNKHHRGSGKGSEIKSNTNYKRKSIDNLLTIPEIKAPDDTS